MTAESPAGPRFPISPRLDTLVTAFLVLVSLVSLVWLVLLVRDGSSRRAAEAAGVQAAQAARDAIPAILSYQPATAETDLPAAATDRLTGKFLADYTQLITTVVVPEAKQKGLSAAAEVPAVAVVSADSGHAVVLAYVDQSVQAGAAAPTQINTSVRVTMDQVDGRWLISGLDRV